MVHFSINQNITGGESSAVPVLSYWFFQSTPTCTEAYSGVLFFVSTIVIDARNHLKSYPCCRSENWTA